MKIALLVLASTLIFGNLSANEPPRQVLGSVTDEKGETLPYANILIKGTAYGVATDTNGKYKLIIPRPGKYSILVKYAGFVPFEQSFYLHKDTIINFKLKEDALNLNEVTVTATRTPKLLKDAPVITRVITTEDIQRINAVTVQDLLETELPGLEFTREMDGQTSIHLQGMSGKYILFLIDGERMAGETLNNVDYNRLNASEIERIEIVKGTVSALYGSNAIGGVVNIITKNADKPYSVNVYGNYGSKNEQRYGATVGLKKQNISSLTSVNYKNKDTDNSRNGHSQKTMHTSYGDMDISIPRDRNGEYEPQLIKKYQNTVTQDMEEKILSMYAKGMTTGDIESHMKELYDMDISDSTISRITDKILPIVKQWQERPLEEVYAVVFMDAIHYHVRSEGRIVKRAVYIALGIDMTGKKDVLGMYVGENESAKFWLSIMNGLKNRGVQDILIACVDGLSGFPQAIEAVYPETEIQQCIIHQIRNSTKFVSYKDIKKLMADLKQVYAAPTEEAARNNLELFKDKWNSKYPKIYKWGCGHFLGLIKPSNQGSVCTPLDSYCQVMF